MVSETPSKGQSTLRAASSMGLGVIISRISGLVREQVFAYHFGATAVMDAFNVAFRIPNLLRDLLAEGALSQALMSVLGKHYAGKNMAQVRSLARAVLLTLPMLTTVITLLGIIFADELVGLIAPGLAEQHLAVQLTRIMYPFFAIVSLASVFMAFQQILGRFFISGFASTLFNIGSVLFLLLGVFIFPGMDAHEKILLAGGGVVLGGIFQLLAQAFGTQTLWKMPKNEKTSEPLDWKEFKRIGRFIVMGTLGLIATQASIFISTIFASQAGPGAVSWLGYAFRLVQLPIGLLGVTLGSASLREITEKRATNPEKVCGLLLANFRWVLVTNLCALVIMLACAHPFVGIIFERGRFTRIDTLQTALALAIYLGGLVTYSANKVIAPVYFAYGKTQLTVISSFINLGVTWLIAYFFFPHWGFLALPLSTVAASFVANGILLMNLGNLDPTLKPKIFLTNLLELLLRFAPALGAALFIFSIQRKQQDYLWQSVWGGALTVGIIAITIAPLAEGQKLMQLLRRCYGFIQGYFRRS